jgi:pyruvate/2-oxoglutarate dehydrogenase complex dihydrolipoamide acyltransferase (E2) component
MIVEVIMPKQGMYDSDVTLIRWLVESRTTVDVGDPLFVMETDKVESEIEAEDAGILVHAAADGYVAPVGSVIGYVVSTEEEFVLVRDQLVDQ